MSITGTSSGFSGGEGEHYVTKNAFSKKKLNEEEEENNQAELNQFIKERTEAFDSLMTEAKEIYNMLSEAKADTVNKYKINPSFTIHYGTDIIKDYFKDIKTLLKK